MKSLATCETESDENDKMFHVVLPVKGSQILLILVKSYEVFILRCDDGIGNKNE